MQQTFETPRKKQSAKINLNLTILPATDSDLHELISDIIPVDIFDEIDVIALTTGDRLNKIQLTRPLYRDTIRLDEIG